MIIDSQGRGDFIKKKHIGNVFMLSKGNKLHCYTTLQNMKRSKSAMTRLQESTSKKRQISHNPLVNHICGKTNISFKKWETAPALTDGWSISSE